MNYDMPGEDLEETDSYLRMKMTPDSRPSYLNDLIGDLLRFTDQTEIRTQTGNNSPFNYRLVPFISSSDHVAFLDAGIPAMQFNHWPDNFYHSSGDVAERTDPTEMKRTGFIGAASFFYLATADSQAAMDLAWEVTANGEKWMSEVSRQAVRLMDVGPEELPERFKAAKNKVYGAATRGMGALASVTDLSEAPQVTKLVTTLSGSLEAARDLHYEKLEGIFQDRARDLGIDPLPLSDSDEEKAFDRRVPQKLYNFYSEEYQEASTRFRQLLPGGMALPRLASTEIPWFVNGQRSITEIWKLVRAEYGNVTTSSDPWKFAYVLTPETPDVRLEDVVAYLQAMEEAGLVQIRER